MKEEKIRLDSQRHLEFQFLSYPILPSSNTHTFKSRQLLFFRLPAPQTRSYWPIHAGTITQFLLFRLPEFRPISARTNKHSFYCSRIVAGTFLLETVIFTVAIYISVPIYCPKRGRRSLSKQSIDPPVLEKQTQSLLFRLLGSFAGTITQFLLFQLPALQWEHFCQKLRIWAHFCWNNKHSFYCSPEHFCWKQFLI